MENFKPSYDQILSFKLGDLPIEESLLVENWLKLNSKNRGELEFIDHIHSEIQNTTFLTSSNYEPKHSPRINRFQLAFTFIATAAAFVAGLYFPTLTDTEESTSSNIRTSLPITSEALSLDTHYSLNYL